MREIRSCNVLVFGLSEQPNSNREERIQIEKQTLTQILQGLNQTIKMENLSFHRVGKYNDGKNRPIKITLPTKEEALALLKTKSRIPKDATYYLKSDRTKMEKDFLKKVVDELNDRKTRGEQDIKIRYYNNIPRIVKYRSIPKNSISNNATSSEAPNVSKKN